MKNNNSALLLLFTWTYACADTPSTESAGRVQIWNEMYPERAEAVSADGDSGRGMETFITCVRCHRVGALGRPDSRYPRLAGQHVSVLIKQIADIQTGRRLNPEMLPYVVKHKITPQDIADIAIYLHGLPVPPGQGKGPGDNLAHGQQLYERDCAVCHGPDGMGNADKHYPRISGQHFNYLQRESQKIRDGDRHNAHPEMISVIKHYTDNDITSVADFMSRMHVDNGAQAN